jgi:hypothetical protein
MAETKSRNERRDSSSTDYEDNEHEYNEQLGLGSDNEGGDDDDSEDGIDHDDPYENVDPKKMHNIVDHPELCSISKKKENNVSSKCLNSCSHLQVEIG